MANFPTSIPPAGTASTTDSLQTAGHTALHNDNRDEIRALATKLGTGASTPSAETVLRGTGNGVSAFGSLNELKTDMDFVKADVGLGNVDNTSDATKKTDIIGTIYPVGSIYISVNSTNPATVLGIGTWVAFGEGKVLVGLDSDDTDFDTAEETGGLKETVHAYGETPLNASKFQDAGGAYLAAVTASIDAWLTNGGSSETSSSVTIQAVGGTVGTTGTTNTEVRHRRYTAPNLQPYITVYMFKRTA